MSMRWELNKKVDKVLQNKDRMLIDLITSGRMIENMLVFLRSGFDYGDFDEKWIHSEKWWSLCLDNGHKWWEEWVIFSCYLKNHSNIKCFLKHGFVGCFVNGKPFGQ